MQKKHKIFYTDGACAKNPGPGGWAFVEIVETETGYETKVQSGNKENTTNNEMELMAAYKALVKSLKEGAVKVTIYSDSAYVVNAIGKGWLKNWVINGWKTLEGKEVKNRKIWEKMDKLIYAKGMEVKIHHIKGHDGHIFNELADREAVKARKQLEDA